MKRILLVLAILAFTAYGDTIVYSPLNVTATVCDQQPLFNITNILISPDNNAYSDQLVMIQVAIKNTGNCYTISNASVYLDIYNSLGMDVKNASTVSNSGLGPGTISYLLNFSAYFTTPDTYLVNVTLNYSVSDFNGTTIFTSFSNKSTNMTITTRPSTTPGPITGGGGGGMPSVIRPIAFIQFEKYPVINEIAPGSMIIVDLGIKNPLGTGQNISIDFTGIPSNWLNLFQSNIHIDPYQIKTVSFTVQVPDNAEAGDYLAKATIHDSKVSGYSYFVIRVKKYPDNYPAPMIYRRVDLNFVDNRSTVQITVQNDANSHRQIDIYEKIPKLLADNVRQVDFETQPSSIIQADPTVMFTLENVRADERREISYIINNAVAEYEPYVYWQIEQINVLYEKESKVQISNIYQTILERGGVNNYLIFDIGNIYTSQLNVTIEPWLPQGWNSTPDKMFLVMPPRSQTNVKFKINTPPDAPNGVYYGGLYITYENSTISRELVFRIQEIGPLAWFTGLFDNGLLLLVIIAVIVVVAIRVARARRGYEYKEDMSTTLSEMKSILRRR
jgi:hypothetical protein